MIQFSKIKSGYIAGCLLTLLTVSVFAQGLGLVASDDASSMQWNRALQGGKIEDSSPTLADIDHDGYQEVIIGTTKHGAAPTLVVLEHNGDIKWEIPLDDPINSSPAVADLDSPTDGDLEIVVSTGGDVDQKRGSVIAFNRNGQQIWKYDTNDAQNTGTPSGNFASPTIGDVDQDGDYEIVIGSWDRNIYMLDHQGHYLWHYHVADSVWSTAALADLNEDGELEIIVGTDITGGGILPDGYQTTDGGFVLILDNCGRKLARHQMNEAVYSSPAVGDVDRDGDLEIFVGTGMFFYRLGRYSQPYVYGFEVDTGSGEWVLRDLPGWPRPVAYAGMSSPALADLDGDKDLEVVIGTGYDGLSEPGACSASADDPQCYGALYAWHHSGHLVEGFPMWPMESSWDKNGFIRSSPSVADVDKDGSKEIVFSMAWDIIVVGPTGVQEGRLHTEESVFASPAISDLDKDGAMEVVIGGSSIFNSGQGHVYNFEFTSLSQDEVVSDWAMFHRDIQKTGVYPRAPELRLELNRPFVMHDIDDPNTEETIILELENIGLGEVKWWYQEGPSNVIVTPSSGILDDSSQELNVAVDMNDYTDGHHNVELTFVGQFDGEEVLGSPIVVSLHIYKGEVHSNYVPLVMRRCP
jgi:hypothetical protein